MYCIIRLFGLGKTNSSLAEVIDRVVSAQESIAEDDQGAHGLGEVHAHKGGNAAARHLKDVVRSREAVLGASKAEGDVGEGVALGTVDGVLATVALLGANLSIEKLGDARGENVEGGTSVEDGTSVLKFGDLIAKSNGVEVNLPIGLAAERNVLNLARVVGLINATKGSHRTFIAASKVEGENRLIQKLLVHHLVKGRNNTIDGNGIVAKAKNTVKAAKGKGKAGLAGSLGKVLALDREVADSDNIVGNESSQATRSVVDFKIGSILLVRRRGRRIVRGVQEAGNAVAGLRGNPEVGASRVKDDLESLGRRADGNLGEVYPTQVSKAVHSLAGVVPLHVDSHWAFMKLVTGTGWPPLTLGTLSLNMTSTRLVGRTPMYFWPSCWTWASMDEPSYGKREALVLVRPCRGRLGRVHTSCCSRETFCSFILWTPAWAEPTSAAAAINALFILGDTWGLDDGVFLV